MLSYQGDLTIKTIRIFEEIGKYDLWLRAVEKLPAKLRLKELKKMLAKFVKKGDSLEQAEELAKRIGRELTDREIGSLIKAFGEKELKFINRLSESRRRLWLEKALAYFLDKSDVHLAIRTARQLHQKLTNVQLIRMFEFQKSNAYWLAQSAANQLPEPFRTRKLEEVLSWGISLKDAKKTAKMIGRSLSRKELQRILRSAVKWAYLDEAILTAKELGRKLTEKELDRMLARERKSPGYYKLLRIAQCLPATERRRELAARLDLEIEGGRIREAQYVAKAMGRKLKAAEIERIFQCDYAKMCKHNRKYEPLKDHKEYLEEIGRRLLNAL